MATVPKERAAAGTRKSTERKDARPAKEPTLRERYEEVKRHVAEAARKAGRPPQSISLVAVTKYAAIDQVRELLELGHADFGENQVQNLLQRAAQLDEFLQRHRQLGGAKAASLPKSVRWHMIGHLQRNKVRKLLGVVRLIHSVDSLRLAEEIQAFAAKVEEPIEVLVQVNISGEKSKFGIAPAAAKHLIDQIDTMLHLRVRGLMGMGPLSDDQALLNHIFERGRELFEDIRKSGAGGERFDILSMGMSADFELAIQHGANMVRIGSAIFGDAGKTDENADNVDGE